MIKNWLGSFRLSGYLKNIITTVTGSGISQILPIITAPILSRIYTPADYGVLGLYMGSAIILGTISTLQYTNAFLLPKENEDFGALIKLTFWLSFLSSLFVGIVLIIFHDPIINFIGAEKISSLFYLLPASMLMTGISNTLMGYCSRKKMFSTIAKNRIIAAISTVIFSISIGIIYKHWIGLVIGYLISQIVNSIILYFRIRDNIARDNFPSYPFSKLKEVAKRYSVFPKYGLTTDLLNNFTYQGPVFLLNIFSGSFSVGAFNMCNRLLALPSSFISNSVGEVFKQKASEDIHTNGTCRPLYVKTFKWLALTSIIPFIIIIFFGPQLFTFFLGEKWQKAGEFARILAPIYFLRFTNSPLSFVVYLFGKLKVDLIATIYLNVSSFVILYFSLKYLSIQHSLIYYAINFCLVYMVMMRYSFNLSNRKNAI